jgi:hypothetical protein
MNVSMDGVELVARISENTFRSAGIDVNDLDELAGSTLTLMDDYAQDGSLRTTGEERIEQVLDGTYQTILCNRANSRIVKSDVFKERQIKARNDVKASLLIKQAEKRESEKRQVALDRMLANAQRRNAELNSGATPVADPAKAVLDDNAPF